MYSSPSSKSNPQGDEIVRYIVSYVGPFHTVSTLKPTVDVKPILTMSPSEPVVRWFSESRTSETTLPAKTAADRSNSSEGEPGSLHEQA